MENEGESIGLLLDLALKHLSHRPRTVWEMQEHLGKKGFSEDIIKKTIACLLEKNYLNDMDFADGFIESRVKYKPKSKFALEHELKQKGITSCISDPILAKYEDEDLALKAIRPKINTWQNIETEKLKKKIVNFLRYRGFNYDIISSTLNLFLESKDGNKRELK